MKNLIPIDGEKNLFRDLNTNAIINTSTSDYKNYSGLKQQKNIESEKISNMENEIFRIKDDIEEIKNLLRGLIKWIPIL